MMHTIHAASIVAALSLLSGHVASQNGVTWNLLSRAGSPGPRNYHAMAADPVLGRAVMFGGLATPQAFFGDTWSWDGSVWSEMQPATSPDPRYRTSLVHDPVNGGVLLFGGYGDNLTTQDTWLWNGTDWQELFPPTSPGRRSDHMMAADVHRQRVVLFGGYADFRGPHYDDTWEWDGVTWVERTPAVGPSRRVDSGMTYDHVRRETVLFGGYAGNQMFLRDTWVWDGSTWTERLPATPPGVRTNVAMVYDPARDVTVLAGGLGPGLPPTAFLRDTWEWDGTEWAERAPLREVPHWWGHKLIFDETRGRIVAFGGYRIITLGVTSEFGSYSAEPAVAQYGTGCPGSAGVPEVASNAFSLPFIGDDWAVVVRNLPAGALPLLAIGVDQASAPVPGLVGCTLLTTADVMLVLPAQNGQARFVQSLPGDPALAGVSLHYQGFALNAGAPNPWGLALSAGRQVTTGMW